MLGMNVLRERCSGVYSFVGVKLLCYKSQLIEGRDGMASNNTTNRGFASMDEDKQRAIASKGGKSQGKENNPGNFANDRRKASEAGEKGGEHSHRND